MVESEDAVNSQCPSRPPRVRGALRILLGILFIIAVFPAALVTFYASAALASVLIELKLDMMVDNAGLAAGSLLGAVPATALAYSLVFSRARIWRLCLSLALAVFVASVGYSVHFSSVPPFEFVGATSEEIYELSSSAAEPPEFLLTINTETRPVKVLTPERPLMFHLDREGRGAVSFGGGAPETGGSGARVEVYARGARDPKSPVFTAPLQSALEWNDFKIPAAAMPPGMKSFIIRLVPGDNGGGDRPRAFISRPRAPGPASEPNIILVTVDTFRADRLGPRTAPFLTRLIERSTTFTQATAPCSYTIPSTASILTGLYPHEHGYISNAHLEFKHGVVFVSERLAQEGYKTAAVSTNRLIDPRHGFGRGFQRFISLGRHHQGYLNSGRILTLHAKDLLRSTGPGPFFLYLHYMEPHYPYLAPWPDTFFSLKGGPLAKARSLYSFFRYDNRKTANRWLIEHPEAVPGVMARYQGEVRFLDRQLEGLMNFLGEQGLIENTVVIVTSDHGEAFGEHQNYRHGQSLFQEEIYVPFVIFDGRRPRQREISTPVSTTLIPSLIAGIVGVRPAGSWHAGSLDSFEPGKGGASEKPLASILFRKDFAPRDDGQADLRVALAARQGWLKIIKQYYPGTGATTVRLYDLEADPRETEDLWPARGGDRHPLYRWMLESLPDPQSIYALAPSKGDRARTRDLRALGYIQ